MSVAQRTNLDEEFGRLAEPWVSRVAGEFNGQLIKVLNLAGDRCGWHAHAEADELFWVVAGRVELHFRAGCLVLGPGEFAVARAGTEHRVVPLGPARLVVIQPPAPVERSA